jgi:uncharacterized protein (TIGR02118 family)
MIQVSIFYPQQDEGAFDENYYMETHIPLVRDRLTPRGLLGVDVYRGVSAPNPSQPPQYGYMCYLYFNTVDEVHQAFMAEGHDLMGDIPNYTNVKPAIQISETLD